jgi:hypothetical protein
MDFETLCKILNFVMGMLAMLVLQQIANRYAAWRANKTNWIPELKRRGTLWIAAVLVILGSLFVGVQSYQTDQAVRDLTRETQRCYREFATSIDANRKIGRENDELSRQQRDALGDTQMALSHWLGQLLTPPVEIAELPSTHPRRRDFNLKITREFNEILTNNSQTISNARDKELANEEERKLHPFPKPTCGVE